MKRLALMAGCVVALAGSLLAQGGSTARQAATPADPLAVLTAEIRALRGELAETTRANLRMQALLARLQLQEQRIMYLDRQRGEVAKRLADVAQERMRAEGAMKTFGGGGSLTPEEQKEVGFLVRQFKEQLEAHQTTEQQLRAEENQVLGTLGVEQARWTDFSNRLDELERSLSRP